MSISWLATGTMLTGWGTVGSAIAIGIATFAGRRALSDYRAQKLTDRQIFVAENALTAAYAAQDAVEGIRGRWMPAAELHATEEQLKDLGMDLDGMSEAEKSAYLQRGVIYRRAEFFKADFDAIFAAIPAVRAYFSQTSVDALKQFPRARNRILTSSDMLPMMASGDDREDRELYRSVRSDVFGLGGTEEKDQIQDLLQAAMEKLENELLPIVRPENK